MPGTPLPGVERLVPHGPPMRLVDEVVEALPDGVVCRTTIGDDFVFLRDGAVDVAVTVELVAQAVACFFGLRAFAASAVPRPGLLVACREARFFAPHLAPGDELVTTARRKDERGDLATFVGEVVRAGTKLATVELTVSSAAPPRSP